MARGMRVTEATLAVGYERSPQFSPAFKGLYGQPPRQWNEAEPHAAPWRQHRRSASWFDRELAFPATSGHWRQASVGHFNLPASRRRPSQVGTCRVMREGRRQPQ